MLASPHAITCSAYPLPRLPAVPPRPPTRGSLTRAAAARSRRALCSGEGVQEATAPFATDDVVGAEEADALRLDALRAAAVREARAREARRGAAAKRCAPTPPRTSSLFCALRSGVHHSVFAALPTLSRTTESDGLRERCPRWGGGWDRRVMVAGFTNRTLARVRGLHQSVSQGAARVSTHLAAGLTNVRLPAPSSPAAADTAARLPLAPLARWRVCGRPSTRHRCLSEHPAESPPDTHTSGLMSHAQHSVQPHAHHAPRVRGLTVAACGRSLWDRRSTARVRAGQTTRRRRTRLRRSPLRR